ncbi:hypothetical protein CCUS01_06916 [Colletotrichum cuscutae]|uniref:Uncharacterized protein n=1 Tax=Colletotrichum cuscutae TaxID=1209917 RepID=A0AAI9V2B7_9PEZI|nr:hypothetical protein CCUS01_06916 [Colletotrichum cuscutae]
MTSTPTPIPRPEPVASSDGPKSSTAAPPTTKPDTLNTAPRQYVDDLMPSENYFATWYFLNLAALATIGSLSVRPSPSGDEDAKLLLAIPATVFFFITGAGVFIMTYGVWPRTGHQRILSSILGFTATLIYGITVPSWTVGVGQTLGREFCLLSGFHVGFWIEGVTGLMGLVLEALKNSKEEPLPRKIRTVGGKDAAKTQPSSSSGAAQNL